MRCPSAPSSPPGPVSRPRGLNYAASVHLIALAGLVVYLVVLTTVLAVRRRAAAAIVNADEPYVGRGLPTGEQLARRFLDEQGLSVVEVVEADVDAYRALTRELQLAGGRDERASVAAWTVAAHEVGHAAQHRAADPNWSRWWVLSGHGVWISAAVPALLVLQLVIPAPFPIVLAVVGAAVLVATAWLSWAVEREATLMARALLDGSGLPPEAIAWAHALLKRTAASYVAESLLHVGVVDGLVEPRAPAV